MIEPGEPPSRFHTVDVPSLEGWIAIGRPVGAVPEADRAPLAVLRFILAERLNIAAREKRGLANRDDFEVPETASGTGLLLVRTGGRPEAVGPLVRYSLDEIARMHDPDAPVSDARLSARRDGCLGPSGSGRSNLRHRCEPDLRHRGGAAWRRRPADGLA